jgi:hypothetical protein
MSPDVGLDLSHSGSTSITFDSKSEEEEEEIEPLLKRLETLELGFAPRFWHTSHTTGGPLAEKVLKLREETQGPSTPIELPSTMFSHLDPVSPIGCRNRCGLKLIASYSGNSKIMFHSLWIISTSQSLHCYKNSSRLTCATSTCFSPCFTSQLSVEQWKAPYTKAMHRLRVSCCLYALSAPVMWMIHAWCFLDNPGARRGGGGIIKHRSPDATSSILRGCTTFSPTVSQLCSAQIPITRLVGCSSVWVSACSTRLESSAREYIALSLTYRKNFGSDAIGQFLPNVAELKLTHFRVFVFMEVSMASETGRPCSLHPDE